MKKVMIFIFLLTSIFVVGCNSKKEVKKHNIDNSNIEINSLESNGTLVDTKTYNYESDEKTMLVVFKRYTNNGETYAILKGYEENDKLVWVYTTNRVKETTESTFELLGGEEEKVLVKEIDSVVILNANDGKKISKIDNLGNSLVYIGKSREINNSEKEYLFIGKLGTDMNNGMTNIISIDCDTFKIYKNVELPEEYSIYEYEMKTVDGAPNDIYLVFTKYTAQVDADNTTGFFVSDTLKNDFKAKVIVINYTE